MNPDQWKDKVAIITGAASGIGKATALQLHQMGCQVLAVDLPGSPLEELATDRLITLEQDIAQANAAEKIVAKAIDCFGHLDILFNNAGVALSQTIDNITEEKWSLAMDVHLNAPLKLCQAAAKYLRDSTAGRIINTTSVMATFSGHGLGAYSASKAALAGLTRTLAIELGKAGVTVNHIQPGAVITGMTSLQEPKAAEVWSAKAALKRLGKPQDISNVVVFLASDEAAFITGQGIRVDGGLMLKV